MKNERERIIGSRINGPGSYTLKALSRTRGGKEKKKEGGVVGRARAEPMTLPFSVTVMVKPVRIQVISANIKKYFTSIRGHGEHIDSPFSNENSLHRLPRPICIETEIPRSFRIASLSFLLLRGWRWIN